MSSDATDATHRLAPANLVAPAVAAQDNDASGSGGVRVPAGATAQSLTKGSNDASKEASTTEQTAAAGHGQGQVELKAKAATGTDEARSGDGESTEKAKAGTPAEASAPSAAVATPVSKDAEVASTPGSASSAQLLSMSASDASSAAPTTTQSTIFKDASTSLASPAANSASLPAPKAASSRGASPAPSSTSSSHPPPVKKFASLNVNKKFLEKSATPSPTLSISKPTAPAAPAVKPPTLPTSRLLTTRLVHPRPIQAASAPAPSSKWGTTPSPKPIGLGAEARGPGLGKASSTPWGDARRQAAAAGALSLEKNFPTTKESAEGKALAQAAKQKAAATSAAAQQARLEELDAFRGAHLNPNAHHWDDVDDEDDNFLDEVVEFGDGTQYKVHENPNPEPESSSSDTEKHESERNAWGQKAPAPAAPPPPTAPRALPPSSVLRSPTNQFRSLPPHQSRGSSSAPGGRSRQDESSRVLFNERSNQFESSRMGPAAGARPPLSHPSAMPPSSGRRMSQERAPARGFDRPPPPHVELQRSLPPHLEGQGDSAAMPAPPARSPWGLPREPAGRSSLPLSDPARSALSPLSQQRGVAPQAAAPSASARGPLLSQSLAFTTGAGPQARRPSATLDRPAAPPSLSPTVATSPLPRKDAAPPPGQEPSLATRRLSAAEAAQKMTKEEVEAMQKDEMHSAAERARLRRQEEEEERNAARERAKKKAEELAERFKAKPTETMTPKAVDPSPVAKAEPPKGHRGEPLDMASQRPVTILAPRTLPPNQAPIALRQQQQKSAAPPSGPAAAAVPRPAEVASKKSAALPATPAGPPPPPAAPASAAGSSAPVPSPPVLNPPAASVWARKGTQLPPPPKIFKNQPVPSDVDVVDFADLGKLVSPTSAPPQPPTMAPALSSAAPPPPSSPAKPRRLAATDFFDNPPTSSSASSSVFKPFPSRLGPQAQAKSDLDLTLPTRPPQTSPSFEAVKAPVPPTTAPACSASQQTLSPSLLSEQVVPPLRSSESSASAPPAQPPGLTPGGFPKVVPSPAKSSFRETGISPASFDDMLLRIKGAMDSGGDVPKASAMSGPVGKGRANDYQSSSIQQPVPKRAPQSMPIVPEDIVTRYERPASPPLPWKVYNVRLPKDERKRPPIDPRQAKLLRREMDRIDILTWSPTLYKSLNSKTYSRDDMLLLSMYGRRPGKHIRPLTPIVRLKPVPKGSDRKSKGSSSAPSQPRSSRATPVASAMPTRPPSPAPVPVILTSVIDQPRTDPAPAPVPAPAVAAATPAVASAPERATRASPNHSLPAISVQPPTSARAPRPAAGRAMEEASWRRKTVEPPKSVPAKPMTPVWSSKEAAVNEAKLDPASSGTLGKVESAPLDAANSISQQISLAKGLPNTSAATLTSNTLQPKAQPSRIPDGNSDVSFYRDRASSIGAQSEEQLAPLVRFMMTSEIDDFKLEELGPKSTEPGRENILEFASIMRSPSSLRETADGDDSTSSVPRLPNNGASLALSPPSEATSSAWSKPLAAPLLNAKEQQVKDVWAQTQDSSTSGPPTQSRMRGAFSSAGGYRYTPPEIAAASSPGGGVGGAFGHRTVSGPGGHVQRPNYGNVGQQQGQQQQPSTPAGSFASPYGVARSASGQPNPAAAPFQPGGGAYSSGRPNPAAPPFHYSGQQARAAPSVPVRPTFSPYNSNVSLSPSGSSSGYPSPLMNQPPSLSPHPQQQPQQQGQPFRSQQQQQQQGAHPSAVGGAISMSPGSAPFPVGIPQQGGVWLPVSLSTSRPGASGFGGGVVGAGGRLPSPYSPAQALPPGGTVAYSPHQHMRNLSDFSIPSSVAPATAVGGAGKPSGSGAGGGQPSGMFSNGGRGPLDARTGGGGGPGQQQMHRALLPHLQGPPHMSHQQQHHQQQAQGPQQQQQQQQPVFASVASSPGPYGAGAFGYQGVGGTGGGRW